MWEGMNFAVKVTRQTRHPSFVLDKPWAEYSICQTCRNGTRGNKENFLEGTLVEFGLRWDESFKRSMLKAGHRPRNRDTHHSDHTDSHHLVEVIRGVD
jgi:hypothetical protein